MLRKQAVKRRQQERQESSSWLSHANYQLLARRSVYFPKFAITNLRLSAVQPQCRLCGPRGCCGIRASTQQRHVGTASDVQGATQQKEPREINMQSKDGICDPMQNIRASRMLEEWVSALQGKLGADRNYDGREKHLLPHGRSVRTTRLNQIQTNRNQSFLCTSTLQPVWRKNNKYT